MKKLDLSKETTLKKLDSSYSNEWQSNLIKWSDCEEAWFKLDEGMRGTLKKLDLKLAWIKLRNDTEEAWLKLV